MLTDVKPRVYHRRCLTPHDTTLMATLFGPLRRRFTWSDLAHSDVHKRFASGRRVARACVARGAQRCCSSLGRAPHFTLPVAGARVSGIWLPRAGVCSVEASRAGVARFSTSAAAGARNDNDDEDDDDDAHPTDDTLIFSSNSTVRSAACCTASHHFHPHKPRFDVFSALSGSAEPREVPHCTCREKMHAQIYSSVSV